MQNIQVVLRVRPLNPREVQRGEEVVWAVRNNSIDLADSKKQQYFSRKMSSNARTTFAFDCCYSPYESNSYIYSRSMRALVLSSLRGINGTLFMYGQTGSGKTFTMLGYDKAKRLKRRETPTQSDSEDSMDEECLHLDSPNPGVLVLAVHDLFNAMKKDLDKTFTIKCSYIEIYNQSVYDLLAPSRDRLQQSLPVSENERKEFQVKAATMLSVSTIDQVLDAIRKGQRNRHYAQTSMNHKSSRSHTVFRLHIHSFSNQHIRNYRQNFQGSSNVNNRQIIQSLIGQQKRSKKGEGTVITEALLNLVDLAGSQKLSSHYSNVQKEKSSSPSARERSKEKLTERVKQGKHINKSLFFLMQVISIKAEGKGSTHIPYRNSTLTKILRSSLGGNSRTLIVLCVTPTLSQVQQSVSTLRFGTTAKRIENNIEANVQAHNDQGGIRMMIVEYEKKIQDLQTCRTNDKQRIKTLKRELEQVRTQERSQDDARLKHFHQQLSSKNLQIQQLQEKVQLLDKLNSQSIKELLSPASPRQTFLVLPETGILFGVRPQKKGESESLGQDQHLFKHGMKVLKERVNYLQLFVKNLLGKTVPKIQEILDQLFSFKLLCYKQRHEIAFSESKETYLVQKLLKAQAKIDLYEKQRNLSKLQMESLARLNQQLQKSLAKVRKEISNRELISKLQELNPDLRVPALQKSQFEKPNFLKDFKGEVKIRLEQVQSKLSQERQQILSQVASLFRHDFQFKDIQIQPVESSGLKKKSDSLCLKDLNTTLSKQDCDQKSEQKLWQTQSPNKASQDLLFRSIEQEISSAVSKVLGYQRKKKKQ